MTPDAEVEIVRKGGGLFEIERDGALVYSKKAEGRFPEEDEIRNIASA